MFLCLPLKKNTAANSVAYIKRFKRSIGAAKSLIRTKVSSATWTGAMEGSVDKLKWDVVFFGGGWGFSGRVVYVMYLGKC